MVEENKKLDIKLLQKKFNKMKQEDIKEDMKNKKGIK